MSFPYKLIVFDLDGTLTESKLAIEKEMVDALNELSVFCKVAIISGGSFPNFENQLLMSLRPSSNIILLPTDGSERFEYDESKRKWKMTDMEIFSKEIKKEVVKVLNEIIDSSLYDIPREHTGEYIEDRDTEITFSALGQNAPIDEKKSRDPDQKKRQKIRIELEKRLPKVSASVAGTTSIDILPKGFSKTVGLELLLKELGLEKKDAIFVGDALFVGGNDYSVSEDGIKSIKVKGPEETLEIIKGWLNDIQKISTHKQKIEHKEKTEHKNNDRNDDSTINFPKTPIVYFCSEYAIEDNSNMYAGGLGILAGDYLLEMADHNIPFLAIGLKYGNEVLEDFNLLRDNKGDGKIENKEDIVIDIPIGKDIIKAKAWHRELSENTHIFLLDTDIDENLLEFRKITLQLYDSHFYTRVKQQIVLGIGGIRLISKLNISPSIYHLNEGHTAFAGIAVLAERKEDKDKIVATKHTILSGAGILINLSDFKTFFGPYCKEYRVNIEDFIEKGKYEDDSDFFSTTKFIMNIAIRKNGVSKSHIFFEKKRHKQSELIPITNGVYTKRWQAKELYNNSNIISDKELWNVKKKLKSKLFSYIQKVSGVHLNSDICTLVWARRFALYKQPFLLFSDQQRLTNIVVNQNMPLQIIISGKAHLADKEGEEIIEKIFSFSEGSMVKNRVVYIPDYSISLALRLVQGADIWLNTPERGKEACGTSGMKAGLNGGLQCSVSDGWVDEVSWDGKGWILTEDNTANNLYYLLENEILPSFYEEQQGDFPQQWLNRMRATIGLIEKRYTTERMLGQYMRELYKK